MDPAGCLGGEWCWTGWRVICIWCVCVFRERGCQKQKSKCRAGCLVERARTWVLAMGEVWIQPRPSSVEPKFSPGQGRLWLQFSSGCAR